MGYGKTDQNAFAVNKKFFKVPEAGTTVFFCPPWNEKETKPFREWTVHYNVAEYPIACLKPFGQPCPMCAANDELYKQKENKAAQDLSKLIYAKKSYLYNLIPDVKFAPKAPGSLPTDLEVLVAETKVVDSVMVEPEVKMFAVSATLHKLIGTFFAFNGDIFDPTCGNAVMLQKVKTTGNKDEIARIQPTAWPKKAKLDPKALALLDKMHDLNAAYELPDLKVVQDLLNVKMASIRSTQTYTINNAPQQNPQYQYPTQQQQVQQPVQQPMQQQPVQTIQQPTHVAQTSTTVPVQQAPQSAPVVETVTVATPVVPTNTSAGDLEAFERFLQLQKEGKLPK
jgi:hypothetical protein